MVYISDELREYRLWALRDFLDLGAGPAKIMIFTGPRAVTITDIPPLGSTKLMELVLKKPCGTISGGYLNLEQELGNMVMVSGEPTWARAVNGNGDTAFDCDAGGPALLGNWEVKLNKDYLYAGGVTLITQTRIR